MLFLQTSFIKRKYDTLTKLAYPDVWNKSLTQSVKRWISGRINFLMYLFAENTGLARLNKYLFNTRELFFDLFVQPVNRFSYFLHCKVFFENNDHLQYNFFRREVN
jgi:hypothetical protein